MKNVFINEDYLRSPSRSEFYSDKNTLTDLNKDAERISLQNETKTPTTILDKLKLCLLDDPNYVVWTPVSIIKRSETAERITIFSHSVSSSGEVHDHRRDKRLKIGYDKLNGYWTCSPLSIKVYIQRVVMSSFGFDLPHPSGLSFNLLTVNHKNHNRAINEFVNLEWMTLEENIKDMQTHIGKEHTHFPKPVMITLDVDIGSLKRNSVFYIKNRNELSKLGINDGSIRNAITKGFALYGCFFKTMSVKEGEGLKYGLSEELIKHLNRKICKKLIA